MKCMLTFLAGGIVGAAVALLLAPMKGEDLRAKILEVLKRRGIEECDEVNVLVDKIAAEIESQS